MPGLFAPTSGNVEDDHVLFQAGKHRSQVYQDVLRVIVHVMSAFHQGGACFFGALSVGEPTCNFSTAHARRCRRPVHTPEGVVPDAQNSGSHGAFAVFFPASELMLKPYSLARLTDVGSPRSQKTDVG